MSEIEELRELLRQALALNAQQEKRIAELEAQVAHLQDMNRRLLHHRFGRRNEKSTDPGQQLIPLEGLTCDVVYDASNAGERERVIPARVVKPQRKRTLWSELCPHLRVVEQHLELEAGSLVAADDTFLSKMGCFISEELVYTPGTLHILRTLRQRYGRSDTSEKVTAAPAPAKIVSHGALGNQSVLAMVVHHAADCLPYQRIAEMISRLGAPISRSLVTTACNTYAALATPMLDAMQRQIQQSPVLHIDGSFLFHQDKQRRRHCSRRPLYAIADGQQVVFRWRNDEKHATASDLIPGYRGYLVSDCWDGWDTLRDIQVTRVACHAHARRYFAEIQDIDADAREIITLYTQIYAIEQRATNSGLSGQPLYDYRLSLRQQHTRPRIDQLFAFAAQRAQTRTGPARRHFQYFANHETDLRVFLTDGSVPADNNLAERVLRRNAMLRKNRLFYVGPDCGQHIGTLLSLMVSCRELAINPLDYLTWSLPALLAHRDHQPATTDLVQWTPLAYQQWLEQRSFQVA